MYQYVISTLQTSPSLLRRGKMRGAVAREITELLRKLSHTLISIWIPILRRITGLWCEHSASHMVHWLIYIWAPPKERAYPSAVKCCESISSCRVTATHSLDMHLPTSRIFAYMMHWPMRVDVSCIHSSYKKGECVDVNWIHSLEAGGRGGTYQCHTLVPIVSSL